MKTVKLILLTVTTILFFGMSNVSAQEKKAQTVIIQAYAEMDGTKSKMSLLVTPTDVKSYEIPLNEVGFKNRKEATINNSAILQKEIDKWKNEGFVIDGISVREGLDFVYIVMSKY